MELLKKSMKEKDILLREVYHRVKNNLQIISSLLFLQSMQVKDKDLLTMFKESQNRVRAMSLVHEKLYQSSDIANINLGDYIKSLIQFLSESYISAVKIDIKINIEKINLDVDKVITLGLILNELLSNSFKYAFDEKRVNEVKPEISLEATKQNDFVSLTIQDNGIGLSPEIDIHNQNLTLGIKLVNLLTNQLHGKINYTYENGAKFTILFPINE